MLYVITSSVMYQVGTDVIAGGILITISFTFEKQTWSFRKIILEWLIWIFFLLSDAATLNSNFVIWLGDW